MPDFTDNGPSNFIKYGNDYYATSETNYISKIDPVTLETLEKVTLPVNLETCELKTKKDFASDLICFWNISHRWTTWSTCL